MQMKLITMGWGVTAYQREVKQCSGPGPRPSVPQPPHSVFTLMNDTHTLTRTLTLECRSRTPASRGLAQAATRGGPTHGGTSDSPPQNCGGKPNQMFQEGNDDYL